MPSYQRPIVQSIYELDQREVVNIFATILNELGGFDLASAAGLPVCCRC